MSEKWIFRVIAVVSIVVFLVVIILNRKLIPVTIETPNFVYFLPKLNAIINGTCSILLLISFYFIRYKKDFKTHKKLNLIAFALSAVFLVSYILFHYFVKETSYGGEGFLKGLYYFILITHIVLAALVLPLILISFFWGLKMEVKKHKMITRYSFPVWLYVTITGVVVYLMISPYYTF